MPKRSVAQTCNASWDFGQSILQVFGALIIAKLLSVPIVMSYHTHVPVYIPRYTFSWLVQPMWMVIKFLHIGRDLEAAQVTAANKIRLWNKGVDSECFHPRFNHWRQNSLEQETERQNSH